jgi:hypothetical protein
MVELQPSKLIAWVRFPSPAPKLLVMSGPHSSVVEHFLGKEEVTGSIPVVGSILESLIIFLKSEEKSDG